MATSKLEKLKFFIPAFLFLFFLFLYAMNPNDRIDDSVFLYLPAIWAFPKQFMYQTAFAIPYHILYGPSIWLINKIFNYLTSRDALFIETAYLQSVFYASMGVSLFYLFLRGTRRSLFTSVSMSFFLGFSYAYWSYVRMFTADGITFFGMMLGFFALIYLINRNFSSKAIIFAGIMFSLSYLFAQSVLLAIPISFIYALNKIRSKKDIILGFISFGILFGIFTLPILLLFYKFVWNYPDFNNFISRIYGAELGLKITLEPLLLIKFFKEIVVDVTVAIFGIHPLLFINTLLLYLVLILTVIRKKTDGMVQAMSFYYLLLFVLAPMLNRNSIVWLEYWIFFLIPVLYILSVTLDDFWMNIRKSRKKIAPFVFGLVILFLFILRADLLDEQLPQVWGYRPVGRGIVKESHKEFYDFIKNNTPKNSLILHDREFYYADIVTFTQRYSRRLDYALAYDLIAKGDKIAPYDPQRPIFLISAFDSKDIYIFKDRIEENFHFRFEKNIPAIFDGYKLNLYRFVGIQKTDSFLSNQLFSYYRKSIQGEKPLGSSDNLLIPIYLKEKKGEKFLVMLPQNIVQEDFYLYLHLSEKIEPVSYPERYPN